MIVIAARPNGHPAAATLALWLGAGVGGTGVTPGAAGVAATVADGVTAKVGDGVAVGDGACVANGLTVGDAVGEGELVAEAVAGGACAVPSRSRIPFTTVANATPAPRATTTTPAAIAERSGVLVIQDHASLSRLTELLSARQENLGPS